MASIKLSKRKSQRSLMVDKQDQTAYIKYLEERLQKFSENSSIGDLDLNTLIDTENEIYINNSYDLKKVLNESHDFINQIDQLQRKLEISDLYIQYLSNSFWWKASFPFRFLSRKIKNFLPSSTFDFSHTKIISDLVTVVIYITDSDVDISSQIDNILKQKGFHKVQITIMDLTNSKAIEKIAHVQGITYINLSIADIDTAKILSAENAKYIVNLKDDHSPESSEWLYKMVRPLVNDYSNLSVLYNKKSTQIELVKKETFFKELKNRIFEIDDYQCLLLPQNRDNVQYIPSIVMDGACATARRYEA